MADGANQQYQSASPLFPNAGGFAFTGAPGSQATSVPDASTSYDTTGTTPTSAFVVPVSASTVNGDRVPVGRFDTEVGLQADLYTGADSNPITGQAGDSVGYTGAGAGASVMAGHHPNAGR